MAEKLIGSGPGMPGLTRDQARLLADAYAGHVQIEPEKLPIARELHALGLVTFGERSVPHVEITEAGRQWLITRMRSGRPGIYRCNPLGPPRKGRR